MAKSKELSSFQNMQEWLKEVFQKEDIPSFDETSEFLETLKRIKIRNEAAERDAKAIIKAEKIMKDFYIKKDEELQLVIDFIQLNPLTSRRVEGLASLAEKMKLKEPSLTNFVLGMTEIEDRELLKEEHAFVTSHHMSVFSKKIAHTLQMNEKLRRHLKSLAKVVEVQKTQYSAIENELNYFAKKKKDLGETVERNEKILEEAGYLRSDGISHSDLVEQAKEYKDLNEHLKTLENKLQAYHSLIPSFSETERKVKGKEADLIKLDEELQLLLEKYENL